MTSDPGGIAARGSATERRGAPRNAFALLASVSPVLWLELVAGSRRVRWIVIRGAYGLALFLALISSYGAPRRGASAPTLSAVANVGIRFFERFAFLQLAAVLLLTPAVVAGSIAQERERRTIEHLLASPLGSGQIVLGKLAARVTYVLALLLAGLPVLSFSLMLGGIPPDVLWLTFLATAATLVVAAGASLVVSVSAKRIRDALLFAYLAIGAWIALPLFCRELLRSLGLRGALPQWYAAIGAAIESNPFAIQTRLFTFVPNSPVGAAVGPYVAWQFAVGAALALLAALLLRPMYARSLRRKVEVGRARNKPRIAGWFARHPYAWKEMYVGVETRRSLVSRIAWRGAGVFYLAMLGSEAVRIWKAPPSRGPNVSFFDLAGIVGLACAYYAIVKVLVRATTIVPREKEHGCWESLLGTRLLGVEIVRGALWGALYSARWPAVGAVFLWGAPCAIYPWLVVSWLYLCFALAAIGVMAGVAAIHLSLRFRSSWQANVATGILAVILAVPCLLCAETSRESGFGVHAIAIATAPCCGIPGLTLLVGLTGSTYQASAILFDRAVGRRPERSPRTAIVERHAPMLQSQADSFRNDGPRAEP